MLVSVWWVVAAGIGGLAVGLWVGIVLIPDSLFGHELQAKPSYKNPAAKRD